MKEYALETNVAHKQLVLGGIRILNPDIRQADPYAVSLYVRVVSHGFAGHGELECSLLSFRQFIRDCNGLYALKKERALLTDNGYGSHVLLEGFQTGRISVSGKLCGLARDQVLTFTFDTDQTALSSLCQRLTKDFL